MALADVDGDGDLDLVYGNTNVPFIPLNKVNRVLCNLTRQVAASAGPQVGKPFDLDLYARSAGSPSYQLVLPYAAAGTLRTAVPPFGVFGLDPRGMVVLAPVFVAPNLGHCRLRLAVPAEPELLGRAIYLQGLHITDLLYPPVNWRFTNVLREVIAK